MEGSEERVIEKGEGDQGEVERSEGEEREI